MVTRCRDAARLIRCRETAMTDPLDHACVDTLRFARPSRTRPHARRRDLREYGFIVERVVARANEVLAA
jgi:hypothetical protein